MILNRNATSRTTILCVNLNLINHFARPYIPLRFDSVKYFPNDYVLSKIHISTEIEAIYNDEWKTRGVLPHNKVQLQERVIRADLPLLEQAKFSYYRRTDLPDFQFDRIVHDAKAGWCSASLVKESDGDCVHIYETDRPEDALLLMAVVNILLKEYVRRRLNLPKRLAKITQLHNYHYEFMNHQRDVESIHQLILFPVHFEKTEMCDYTEVIFHKTGMLLVLIHHYINLPVYNTHYKNYICCPHAPPLGDITTCLNHLVLQYLFDRHFAAKYPEIVFTRWGNEVLILNQFSSENKISKQEIMEFLETLDGISGHVNSINCMDEPAKLDGYENPHDSNKLAFTKGAHMQILLDKSGTVNVHQIMDGK